MPPTRVPDTLKRFERKIVKRIVSQKKTPNRSFRWYNNKDVTELAGGKYILKYTKAWKLS